MSSLSPLQKRYGAIAVIVILSAILIGSSLYQNYFSNSVHSLYFLGEVEEFTLPSSTGEDYTFIPGSHEATVVSFIYTKCPGAEGCALLTVNMAELEDTMERKELKDEVEFISIDFDYINDTMQDLVNYRNQYTQDYEFWKFLLGNSNQTHSVADQFNFWFEVNNNTEGLTPSHGDVEDQPDPYNHLMITYILDRDANIRKFISGTEWDFKVVEDVIDFLLSNQWENSP